MIDVVHRVLDVAVVVQAGFVAATVVTVLTFYAWHAHPLKTHILLMMCSYMALTIVIAYNVTFGYVVMPIETAVLALTGFLLGDVALTRYLVRMNIFGDKVEDT